jgi:hypothetical protein
MTRAQYERDKQRLAREKELRTLADALERANPTYVIRATGFWLERWQGKRHPTRGRKRTCQAA